MAIALACVLAFVATVAFIVLLKPLAPKLRLVDQPGGRKAHEQATPVIGGIAIFVGVVWASLLLEASASSISFLLAMGILMAVGVLDDRHDIKRRVRIFAQMAATALMVFGAGIQLHHLGDLVGTGPLQLGILAIPFTFFAVVGMINAVNMSDGADGLAGGLSLIPLTFLAGIAAYGGHYAEAQVLALLVSAVAAFMLFNYRFPWNRRARVFMGDAGSTVLGFAICWFTISLSQGPEPVMSPILAVWLLAMPILDIVAVMIRRMSNGDSPFKPDRRHLHHILQDAGCGVAGTVNRIVGLGLLAATVAILARRVLDAPESVMFGGFMVLAGAYWLASRQRLNAATASSSLRLIQIPGPSRPVPQSPRRPTPNPAAPINSEVA